MLFRGTGAVAAVVTRFKCSLFDDLEIPLEDIFYSIILPLNCKAVL